jgi:murein DD-endopeptidase MepM/ murein hydrolase activator NlpD
MSSIITLQRCLLVLLMALSFSVTHATTPALAQDPPPATETPIGAPVEATPDPNLPPPPLPADPNATVVVDPAVPIDANATPGEVPTAIIETVATLAPPPPEPTEEPVETDPLVHVAQVGETIQSIAAQSGYSASELAQDNRLTRGDLLLAGQKMRLPSATSAAVRLHRIAPGDTLTGIAAEYGVSPYLLRQTSALACASCLTVGQVLRVPVMLAQAGTAGPVSGLPAPFESIKITPSLPKQGDIVVISVTTRAPLQSLVGTLAGRPLTFVQKEGVYLALSGVGAVQDAGVYSVTLRALTNDGVPGAVGGRVQVGAGAFAFENLTINQKLVPLLALDVNLEERVALDGIFNRNFTGAQYWSGSLKQPIVGRIISYYGTRRNFNSGTLSTFHSGIDMPARLGTAVSAAAGGKVVATQKFPVRGNVVIIDHGRGVFTLYCHLSKFDVKVGDLVDAGDTIGFTGNTGRSLGPHLHFELAVGGVTINPLPWLKREIP